MKRQIQQPAAVSHTIQSKPKAAKQADMHTVLQKYAVAQRVEMPEEDELLQGKFETAPLKNGDSLLESGELRMEKGAIQMQARNAARKLLRDNVGKKNISEREAGTVHGLQVSMGKNPQSHHHPTTLRKDVAESLYPWLDRTKDTEDPVQLKSKITHTAKNETGIPNSIKTNFENLSGFSFDDVRVHYNSDKPAQLQALAYTQGNEVHIAPGQKKHLGHELGHVVQQKQGRVQPTMQLQGVNVNDNEGLEKEADVMGGKAVQMRNGEKLEEEPVQMKISGGIIQRTERRVRFDDVKTLYSEQISETKTEEILKARDSVVNRLSGVSGIFLGDSPNDWLEHSAVGYGANDVLKVVLPDFDAFNRTQTFGLPILDSNGLSILDNCKMIAIHELTHLKHSRENLNISGSGFGANTRVKEFGDINLPRTVNSLITDVNSLSYSVASEGQEYPVPRMQKAKDYINERLNYILNTYNTARVAGSFNNAEAPSVMIELNFYLQRLLLPEKMGKNEKDGWENLKKRISDLDNACKKSVKMK